MNYSSDSILVFKDVSKSFVTSEGEVHALKNISFQLERGKSLALTGPSGSGKSTLLNLAAGIDKPSSGLISLEGTPLNEQTEEELARLRSTKIGFIFQSFRLLGSLTAIENVEVPAQLQGMKNSRAQAYELLSQVGLSHRLSHYPNELSGGEQQRVAIARAFISKPTLLLADEPTGNLDYETSEAVKSLIFELQKEYSSSILLVTHDLEFAARTDTSIRIRAGMLHKE